jgi:hypothetical protein
MSIAWHAMKLHNNPFFLLLSSISTNTAPLSGAWYLGIGIRPIALVFLLI